MVSADDLPFDDNYFDIVLCIISLNFFDEIRMVYKEIKRVSAKGVYFICIVPVQERNSL